MAKINLKNSEPFVSIIIPTYNVEKYIIDALNSCLRQTYLNLEIICIDNNSTDKTIDIIINYTNKHPEKIKFLTEIKQGAEYARNTGIKHAKGEWIQFLDADDIIYPTKIEKDIKLIDSNISFLVGNWQKFNLNYEIINVINYEEDLFLSLFKGSNCGNFCANLWRKSSLIDVGGITEIKDTHDQDLMFKLIMRGFKYRRSYHPDTLIRVRPEGGQLSMSDLKNHMIRHFQLRLKVAKELRKFNPIFYTNHSNRINACLILYLRKIYDFDRKSAISLYKEMDYSIKKIKFENCDIINAKFIFFYNLFGFKVAQLIIFRAKSIL